MINLKDIALDTKQIEVEYPGLEGFILQLNHISKNKSREILKASEKVTMKSGRPVSGMDDDKFNELFVEASISGWKGLTLEHLDNLMLLNLEGHDLSEEVPFSIDNGVMLMKNSAAFDEWINGIVFQIDSFRATKS